MGYLNELTINNKKILIDFVTNYSANEVSETEIKNLISAFSIVLRNTTDFQYNYSYLTDFVHEFFENIDIVKKKLTLADILVKSEEIELLNKDNIEVFIDEIISIDAKNRKRNSEGSGDIQVLFNNSMSIKMLLKTESTEGRNIFVKNYYIEKDTNLSKLSESIVSDLKNRSKSMLGDYTYYVI